MATAAGGEASPALSSIASDRSPGCSFKLAPAGAAGQAGCRQVAVEVAALPPPGPGQEAEGIEACATTRVQRPMVTPPAQSGQQLVASRRTITTTRSPPPRVGSPPPPPRIGSPPPPPRSVVEVPVELVGRQRAAAGSGSSVSRPAALVPRISTAVAKPPSAAVGATAPMYPSPSTVPWEPSAATMSRNANGRTSVASLPRHRQTVVPAPRSGATAGTLPQRMASSPGASQQGPPQVAVAVHGPVGHSGRAPVTSPPPTPPMVHRTTGVKPSVQRMESAPVAPAVRSVVRRETGHWEERRIVEVRTERRWVSHTCEDTTL